VNLPPVVSHRLDVHDEIDLMLLLEAAVFLAAAYALAQNLTHSSA
jgi:hypothetical protein